jgi:hypothetical protein
LGCHTLGFAFCARLVRTVWVIGVLDGMSSGLSEFGWPSGCLNTGGIVPPCVIIPKRCNKYMTAERSAGYRVKRCGLGE